jgi:hypothetical protein
VLPGSAEGVDRRRPRAPGRFVVGSWMPYVVRQGDHLAKVAVRMGFDADRVWNSDKNASLRERRPDRNMLCAGDILYVLRRRNLTGSP